MNDAKNESFSSGVAVMATCFAIALCSNECLVDRLIGPGGADLVAHGQSRRECVQQVGHQHSQTFPSSSV